MRWAVIALSLCGCDDALQLRATAPVDARTDAAPVCPSSGVPTFQTALREVAVGCVQYTTSLDQPFATADCGTPQRPAFGAIDTQPVMLAIAGPATDYVTPRVTPEGDEIWLHSQGPDGMVAAATTGNTSVAISRTFALSTTMLPSSGLWTWSSPTRAPQRHVIYVDTSKPTPTTLPKFHELVESSPGVLVDVATPTMMNIDGVFSLMDTIALTADGLRIVFNGSPPNAPNNVYYSVRPTIDAIFPTPVPLGVPPDAHRPFLREDCGRLYFDAVGAVLYLPQG